MAAIPPLRRSLLPALPVRKTWALRRISSRLPARTSCQGSNGMSVVTTEERGPVSIIRVNRPEKLNAISSGVAVELQQAFQAFDASGQRVAILSAAGERAFTSGADVTDLPELWRAIPTVGFTSDKPIIAATSGWCVGGGIVMVMMCDLMVSTENTIFYYPEAKLGITGGMISSLVAHMPRKLAMEMMLLGSKISAQRAYDVGFVNRVVPNGQHESEALAMANEMLDSAPLVIAALKRLASEVLPIGPVEHMVTVSQTLGRVRASEDMQEGIRAHRERRKPNFRGR
ncbi:MAG TPA: enoyl-CoA hydratase/isomerase family protein [Acetobacteraceae bacterium]|nr:enoyl-CoA hydratase/isomerase family protein [Acetobacteraceae bacterium]